MRCAGTSAPKWKITATTAPEPSAIAKASQKGIPAVTTEKAMKVPTVATSAWAKLSTRVDR